MARHSVLLGVTCLMASVDTAFIAGAPAFRLASARPPLAFAAGHRAAPLRAPVIVAFTAAESSLESSFEPSPEKSDWSKQNRGFWGSVRKLLIAVVIVFALQTCLASLIALELSLAAATTTTALKLQPRPAVGVVIIVVAALLAPDFGRALRSIFGNLRSRLSEAREYVARLRDTRKAIGEAAKKAKELEEEAAIAEKEAAAQEAKLAAQKAKAAREKAAADADAAAKAAEMEAAREAAEQAADASLFVNKAKEANDKAMLEARAALKGIMSGETSDTTDGRSALDRAASAAEEAKQAAKIEKVAREAAAKNKAKDRARATEAATANTQEKAIAEKIVSAQRQEEEAKAANDDSVPAGAPAPPFTADGKAFSAEGDKTKSDVAVALAVGAAVLIGSSVSGVFNGPPSAPEAAIIKESPADAAAAAKAAAAVAKAEREAADAARAAAELKRLDIPVATPVEELAKVQEKTFLSRKLGAASRDAPTSPSSKETKPAALPTAVAPRPSAERLTEEEVENIKLLGGLVAAGTAAGWAVLSAISGALGGKKSKAEVKEAEVKPPPTPLFSSGPPKRPAPPPEPAVEDKKAPDASAKASAVPKKKATAKAKATKTKTAANIVVAAPDATPAVSGGDGPAGSAGGELTGIEVVGGLIVAAILLFT